MISESLGLKLESNVVSRTPTPGECGLGPRSKKSLDFDRVYITAEAEDCLRRLSPSELGSFAGAVMCLEDDDCRNECKADLNLPDDRGDPTWAIYFNRLFVAFKELEDRIDVVFVNRRSMFRPPFRP